MPEYLVTWRVDVEADDPRGAAEWARDTQRQNDSGATVFIVEDRDTGDRVVVDLSKESRP